MRRIKAIFISAILLCALLLGAFPATALAAPSGVVVAGNNYTLQSGQTLNDNLLVFGGNVVLENGSTINGDVFLLGGTIQAAGAINGNVVVFGGTLNLSDTSVLHGNLTTAGTTVNRAPGATITGQINNTGNGEKILLPGQVQIPNISSTTSPVFKVIWFFVRLFLWALVAMLLAMFIPNHLQRTAQTAITQPLISGGLGLLTVVVVPILAVLAAITICLIPASVLAILLLVVAGFFGLISFGFEVGKRISAATKLEWHPALSAGLGTLLLMVVLNGVDAVVPCVGWIPKFLVGLFGLGAVLLTQMGMKEYVPTPATPTGSSTNQLPPANPQP